MTTGDNFNLEFSKERNKYRLKKALRAPQFSNR